ncbi:MAG: polymer-forming cytoskeletal protein [Lachnospiraceae bacterium]|jgi:cytoskeletal protein CcmA (bactofilin family)|nr:polymer-forming cytoskeletal protein [Lachnospiraceae bacterium]MCR4936752.1 polymer-forming cytoskeletal protein [Lachnospiraceae bacterium]
MDGFSEERGSFIPRGMTVIGDVESSGDLKLSGEVRGDVHIDGALELDGKVRGTDLKVGRIELTEGTIESNIECQDYISVGSGVTVIGNIKAKNADVSGAVLGSIDVAENMSVGSTAVIRGDVNTGSINIDLGAVCDVDLKRGHSDDRAAAFFEEYLGSREEA